MVVTATEFQKNFARYLELLTKESIYITQDGRMVAKVTNPNISAVDKITGVLEGKLPDDYDRKALRMERLKKYETDD